MSVSDGTGFTAEDAEDAERRIMGKRGPKNTPTAILSMEGSLRADRHGGRRKEPQPQGEPVMPDWLDEAGQAHWRDIVPELVAMKVARAIDAHALALLCDAWSQYQRLRLLAIKDPKAQYVAQNARKAWVDIAARFGLTPSDRTQIEADFEAPAEAAEKFVV